MVKEIDNYCLVEFDSVIQIQHLVTVHYFEYSKNYIFEGEKHNFWEFLYVDKGQVQVMADERKYILKQGEIIFHKPNEWHTVYADGHIAPNLIVIAFDCQSEAMKHLENKVITLENYLKNYLGVIVREAKEAYVSNISDPSIKEYIKNKKSAFGSEQLIKLHLEMLMIELIRNENKLQLVNQTKDHMKAYVQEEKVSIIIDFLKDKLYDNIALEDISNHTLLSKSSIQKLFKEHLQMSAMAYYRKLKMIEAKTLVRENNHNFTEISSLLGFNSIHYFSRAFKNETGMTLTEYDQSVKLLIEKQGQ